MRVTAGLPGTGLFFTKHLNASDIAAAIPLNRERRTWRQAFIDHLMSCLQNPNVTVAQMKAALQYRETLKLTDQEMGDGLLQAVALVSARIMEAEAVGRSDFYAAEDRAPSA
jgi:hypothetical protein